MKMLIIAGALALSACGMATPASIPPGPIEIANRTAADEQAAIGVELAYAAFRTALEIGTDAGVFNGPRAKPVAEADRRVYAAVLAMRAAYRTANSPNFLSVARESRTAIEQALAALKG